MSVQTDFQKVATTEIEKTWQADVAHYCQPNLRSNLWQLTNTFVPFILGWVLMWVSLAYSYWLTLALAPVVAGFQLRIFIIFHDCGHNSFFKTARANAILGSICGLVNFTPYYHWRHFHAIHHATTGNLSRRINGELLPLTLHKYLQNNGDVLTLTVHEYQQLSGWERLFYRFYRQPLLFLVAVPLFLFLVLHRFSNPRAAKRERYSVYWTNLALLLIVLSLILMIGLLPFLMIELPIITIAASAGVWLFYVQHQFEDTYWQVATEWRYDEAALEGSSYYKLPKVLQWFSGNIGFHHIHHLNPRIPNYNLQKCHDASRTFRKKKALTMGPALKSLFLRLWDEKQQRMVSFRGSRLVEKENKI